MAPQGSQLLLAAAEYGATQLLKLQLDWPMAPHGPELLPVHAPWLHLPEKMESQSEPCAAHPLRLQHPPPRQTLPWQHGSPGAPQRTQVLPLHARPAPEQTLPAQQGWPSPPQPPQEPGSPVHVCPLVGHVAPRATQTWLAQQPPPAQVLLGQHGWPGAPQRVKAPATHTRVASLPDAPGGTQRPVVESRHAPPAQGVAPGHAGRYAAPQRSHRFSAVQRWPAPQLSPTATQVLPARQPPKQRWSGHGACPGWPQGAVQVPASQARPSAVHREKGGQQAWPAAPQVPQLPLLQVPLPTEALHAVPDAVHRLLTQHPPLPQAPPGQQNWFVPPQPWQKPPAPLHTTPASAPSHTAPGQHRWFAPPQGSHVVPWFPLQVKPSEQVLPGQHL